MDTTFRTPQTPAKETTPESKKADVTQVESKVEIPYSDYEKENGHPFTVDYLDLGSYWNETDAFGEDVKAIEGFIDNQIKEGAIPNNKDSVKKALTKIEKTIGIDKNDNKSTRVSKLTAYVKFLMECDEIDFNFKKYGNN